ncbi:MAG TPA: glycosyltransferase [Bacteroidales bacterium]|nr:glycosyltransferase [Bacteroidales bacterium]
MSSPDKNKVLFMARWYPNRYDPMPGLFIERHARSVSEHYDMAVLYIHQDEELKNTAFEIEKFRDKELFQVKLYYRPVQLRIPAIGRFINFLLYIFYSFKGLLLLEKEWGQPDLIHVNVLTRIGAIALIHKWLTRVPYVITEHWTRYLPHMDNFRGRIRKAVTRLVVKEASAVLPVTDNLRMAMESHGLTNKNYRIIPNVVDMNMFTVMDWTMTGKKHFIHVSCFEDRQKNISGILRVLKRLSETRDDWECVMIGEGIHLERLIDYAKELEIEGKFVRFTGLKENGELAELMAKTGFQVMFSRFENLPVVILESYACGVPVLSTDVGGIKEHLTDDLGILIRSEDEEELFLKLNEMLDRYGSFDKNKIRDYAERHFSREVIGRQLAEIYREAI